MSSDIIETNPASGSATTSSVRDNFGFAKNEIQELQRMAEDKAVSAGTLDAQTATFGHQNVELIEGSRITIQVGALKGGSIDVTIHTVGSGYAVGDTLNQAATSGVGLGFTCTVTKVSGGQLVDVDITNIGSNYVKDEVITLGNDSSSGSGGKVSVIASNITTTPTLQVDSLDAYTIVRQDGTAVQIGDLRQGQYCDFVLDVNSGTPSNSKWVWVNSPLSTIITTLGLIYPVGHILTTVKANNPGDSGYFASGVSFGTWTAYGAGRVMVGLDGTDTDFDTIKETGGAKTHTLTIAEMPSHNHVYTDGDGNAGGVGDEPFEGREEGARDTTSTGGGQPHNNVQPYITTYFWERTA